MGSFLEGLGVAGANRLKVPMRGTQQQQSRECTCLVALAALKIQEFQRFFCHMGLAGSAHLTCIVPLRRVVLVLLISSSSNATTNARAAAASAAATCVAVNLRPSGPQGTYRYALTSDCAVIALFLSPGTPVRDPMGMYTLRGV